VGERAHYSDGGFEGNVAVTLRRSARSAEPRRAAQHCSRCCNTVPVDPSRPAQARGHLRMTDRRCHSLQAIVVNCYKANAPPPLFFARRGVRLSLFPSPEGEWSAGRRQGLARPHQRTWRGSVPRADQGRVATPALGRAPPSAKGAAPPGAPPADPGCPVSAPKGLGLISDPPSRPAPPARRLMSAACGRRWWDRNIIIRKKVKSSQIGLAT
jgi:hypothetical protein